MRVDRRGAGVRARFRAASGGARERNGRERSNHAQCRAPALEQDPDARALGPAATARTSDDVSSVHDLDRDSAPRFSAVRLDARTSVIGFALGLALVLLGGIAALVFD